MDKMKMKHKKKLTMKAQNTHSHTHTHILPPTMNERIKERENGMTKRNK